MIRSITEGSSGWSIVGGGRLISESAAVPRGIKCKYLGNAPISLAGGHEDYDGELERNDEFEIVPAKTAREAPLLVIKAGNKRIPFAVGRNLIIQALLGSLIPPRAKRDQMMFLTKSRIKTSRLFIADKQFVAGNGWLVTEGQRLLVGPNRELYTEFDQLKPIEVTVSKVAATKLRVAFKTHGKPDTEQATMATDKVVRRSVKAPVADSDPGTDTASTLVTQSNTGFVITVPCHNHDQNVWALLCPTLQSARAAYNVQILNDAKIRADYGDSGVVPDGTLYKCHDMQKLRRLIGNRLAQVSGSTITSNSQAVRKFRNTTAFQSVHARQDERDIDEVFDYPELLNEVSWSSYDSNKVYTTLTKMFSNGFFSGTMVPTPTTKGLKFNYPKDAGLSEEGVKNIITGIAKRVYQFLHGVLHQDVSVKARWRPDYALISFTFKPLTDEQYQSIDALVKNKPQLRAPIYVVDSNPSQTVTIYDYNLTTGECTVYPVRDGSVLKHKGRKVPYSHITRMQ